MKARSPKEVLEYYKAEGLPENFCAVPFSTLLFEANGNVCACRRKGSEAPVGNIKTQTVEEIWNGEMLQKIRREFLRGRPEYCRIEVARDKCNLDPDNSDMLPFIERSEIQSKPPIRISPNFNGQCNLECKMCHIWQYPNGTYDGIGFWKVLEEAILPHLVEIDTFSGEPFLQKDTYRLMDLAHKINPNILWSFTSNVNWRLNNKIRSHLDLLKTKTFNISIDSLNEKTYGEIRKKGSLALALKTFSDLIEYDRERVRRGLSSLGLVLHVVIQKDNWKEIPAFLDLRRKTGVKLHLNYLENPVELSINKFTNEDKREVLQFWINNVATEELKMIVKAFRPLLAGLPAMDRAEFLSDYVDRAAL